MGRRAHDDEKAIQVLKGKCEEYLNDNFHKFKQSVKIKVAIDILKIVYKTDIPTGDTHFHITLETIKKRKADPEAQTKIIKTNGYRGQEGIGENGTRSRITPLSV